MRDRFSSAAVEPPVKQRDHSRLAANYLSVLGVLQLIGCNLAGLLFLLLGRRIRQRNNRYRIAAAVLCGLHVLAAAVGLIVVAWRGTSGTTISYLGGSYTDPPVWVVCVLLGVVGAVFGLPVWWLLVPGTSESFRQRALNPDVVLCANCQYDLTNNTSGRCPECGAAVPEELLAPTG